MTGHRKVVARYADGRLVKGYTFDFGPSQRRFHIFEQPFADGPSVTVVVSELKAVFFVRDLVGNPARQDAQKFPAGGGLSGPHVEVRFRDGEVMVGAADSPMEDPTGFFLVPADPESNNLRVYVVATATRAVYPIPPATRSRGAAPAASTGRAAAVASSGPLLPSRILNWLTR